MPFYYLCLVVAALPAMSPCSTARARPSAWRCRRSATTRAACARSASTSPRIKVAAYSWPASSPGSAACCWSGSTAASRRARSASAQAIDILVIAVIGGMRHPIGPFVGAVVFVLLQTFAIDIVGAERFNTLIGLVFLAIVFFSPDGLLGLWGQAQAASLAQESLRSRVPARKRRFDARTQSTQGRIE